MRRILCFLTVLFILCGCSSGATDITPGLELRNRLLNGNGCSFNMAICADYGDVIFDFYVSCTSDSFGNLSFEVLEPETIRGICGRVETNSGQISFGDVVLALPLLADGEVMPAYAPWIFLNTLRYGCIKDQGTSDGNICLTIMDSYAEDALLLRVYLDSGEMPFSCDVFWQGRTVLSMKIEDFRIL